MTTKRQDDITDKIMGLQADGISIEEVLKGVSVLIQAWIDEISDSVEAKGMAEKAIVNLKIAILQFEKAQKIDDQLNKSIGKLV